MCGSCKLKKTILDKIPNGACERCGAYQWERAAMMSVSFQAIIRLRFQEHYLEVIFAVAWRNLIFCLKSMALSLYCESIL